MSTWFGWIEFALATIGAVPIIVSAYYFLGNIFPVRKFFGFSDDERLDIIATTSQVTHSSVGAKVVRATTGIGQIEGVAAIARFLGQYYRKKSLLIKLSVSVSDRPEKDLILVGGPAKNKLSGSFLSHLNDETSIKIEFDDVNIRLEFDDLVITKDDLVIEDEFPTKDFAIVIAWRNPFLNKRRRGILCAGFTSYGTSGGARWIFNDLPIVRYKKEFFRHGKRPNFVSVLEIELLKDTILSIRPLKTKFF